MFYFANDFVEPHNDRKQNKRVSELHAVSAVDYVE